MKFSHKKQWRIIPISMIVAGLVFGTSCLFQSDTFTLTSPNPLPEFKNDIAFFMDMGCSLESGGSLNCKNPSPLTTSGCSKFHIPSSYLGGLNPAYPMIECSGWDQPDMDTVKPGSCYRNQFYNYAIALGGQYLAFLKSPADFIVMFAPVETPEEAISFAIALTRDYPLFDLTLDLTQVKLSIDKNDIELTHAEKTDDGYKVLLFSDEGCGCYYNVLLTANEYLVTEGGDVTLTNSYEVYHGADEAMICED